MMKISDFIFQYKPLDYSEDDALCRVRIFVRENFQYALLTDLGNKSGPSSVTNSVEYIQQQLIYKGFVGNDTVFIEHYEERFSGYGSFDIVTLNHNGLPDWEKTTLKKVQVMLSCSHEELLDRTLKNDRLFKQIECLHQKLYPFTKTTFVENNRVITKRLQLEENSISKKEIIDFINTNPSESDLSNYLIRDLSFCKILCPSLRGIHRITRIKSC